MTTELTTIDGEIVEQRAPMTLFGTDMPELVVERASIVASALAKVIGERDLTTRIGNKDHVQVEGWTLLGSMLGVFAEVEWTRPLENGWEARAVARTLNGNVVGAAEAMCTRKERTWGNRDDYALRSMAQTRAVSKALRMPLGFIMHLAGYSATPAEELVDEQPERSERAPGDAGRRAGSQPATTSAPVQRTPEEQALADELLALTADRHEYRSQLADEVGVPKGQRANADQLREMIALAIGHAAGTDTSAAARAADQDAGAPVSEELSKPGDGTPLPSPGAPPQRTTVEEAVTRARRKAQDAKKGEQEALPLGAGE